MFEIHGICSSYINKIKYKIRILNYVLIIIWEAKSQDLMFTLQEGRNLIQEL